MWRQALGIALLTACTTSPLVGSLDQADTVCASGPTIAGMDVSSYDTSIDWSAAHAAGIQFAFIRASDGTQYPDPSFATHWADARAAGVLRGAYQYFRPAEDPIAQADLLLSAEGPLQPDDLPPVLDLEVSGGLSTADVTAAVGAWVDHVAAATGRTPIIYAGLYSWPTLTGGADFTTSPLWVAQYTSAACPDIPRPWTSWAFWQDTSTGSVAGVPGGNLDLDVFDGTRDDLLGFAAGAPCGTIAPYGGTIDDGDACFHAGGPPATLRDVTGAGEGGDLMWTHATDAASEANFAQWDLYLAQAGRYHVEVYTDHAYATSRQARYEVVASGAPTDVTIDQSAADGWQPLGDFDFAAGGGQSIHLGDNTGEAASLQAQLVFDAVRLTRLDPPTGSGGSASGDTGGSGDPGSGGHAAGGGCAAGGGGSPLALLAALALLVTRRRRC